MLPEPPRKAYGVFAVLRLTGPGRSSGNQLRGDPQIPAWTFLGCSVWNTSSATHVLQTGNSGLGGLTGRSGGGAREPGREERAAAAGLASQDLGPSVGGEPPEKERRRLKESFENYRR